MFVNSDQLVSLIVIIVILYGFYHYDKKNNIDPCADENQYNKDNCYKKISPLKHDIFKQLTIDLTGIIIFGLVTNRELFNKENIFESVVGKSLLAILGYFVYYLILQPYVINKLPYF